MSEKTLYQTKGHYEETEDTQLPNLGTMVHYYLGDVTLVGIVVSTENDKVTLVVFEPIRQTLKWVKDAKPGEGSGQYS